MGAAEDSKAAAALEELNENLTGRPSVAFDLTKSICHTESLLMLTLTDMPLSQKCQQNLLVFTQTNPKIENFQLINCQMTAGNLALICEELET